MTFGLNNIFGVYEKALLTHEKRTELIANNIANQDTPNFKARDIDFREVMQQYAKPSSKTPHLEKTEGQSITKSLDSITTAVKYRIPIAPSLDGNTVDGQLETAAFAENSLRYQANLHFIDGKMKSLISAFRGE